MVQEPESVKEHGPETRSSGGVFDRFASSSARWTGHAVAFGAAVAVTLAWAASGPLFHFSNTWQLVINTGTTVLTLPDGLHHPEHDQPRLGRRPPKAR